MIPDSAEQDTPTRTGPLSQEHERILRESSGISPDVIAERGVRTVTHGRDLPKEFSQRQRRRAPGILFTGHRPNGETSYIFRPDESDPKNPGHKYEQPCKALGAPGNTLDVHPSLYHLIDDTSTPIMFTEGVKKGDAIVSAARREGVEVLVATISGVWNFLSGGPIPDMFDIPIEGRKATIAFDSDMLRNPDVQDAAKRLAEHLFSRGAEVWITYLHDQADGSKTGADDFFAGGGTFAQLRMLARRYDPEDFVTVRLSRDEQLRLALEDLQRRWWEFEWKGMGGYSARDVALKLIEAAKRHGKVVDDGIRVTRAQGPLAIEARLSTRTLWKALARLEESGFCYRDNDGRKPDKAGSFVLRANVSHKGVRGRTQGTTSSPEDTLYARDLHLRAPRLWWSRPKFTPRRGVVRGTRRVRRSVKLQPRDGIKRLGKIRGGIIDVLEASGGELELEDLYGRLHPDRSPEDRRTWRPRDLTRRKNLESGKGRDGPMVMLEESGILTVEGDAVRLADGWLRALHEQRVLGKEVEADELATKRHRLKSQAFHNRRQVKADEAPTAEEMQEWRESYPERRREAIAAAITRLFSECPEARTWRTGRITCAIVMRHLGPDFPRGPDGVPKDAEVEAILDGEVAA